MINVLEVEAFAEENSGHMEQEIGVESLDNVVDSIVEENKIPFKYEESIQGDIEVLNDLGIAVENISDVTFEDDDLVYTLSVNDSVKDIIKLDIKSDGTITMSVEEESKKDRLVINSDGSVYLDGKKMEYESEEILLPAPLADREHDSMLMPSTGGIKWYEESKAPSKLKKATYGSYRETWRCSNLKLQKALGNITFATICGLVTGISGGVLGFSSTAFYELLNADKSSKNISYIEYTAKAKKNARYYKGRKYVYSKANFKGKKTTSYSYGIML